MKAAVIHSFNGIEGISIEDVPLPTPKDHEVQIAVAYAGVNPVDWKITEGRLQGRLQHQFPIILGWDVAGKVAAKGKSVQHLKEGDLVFAYCRKEIVHEGAFAEFICLSADNVVKVPKKLSLAQAACVPLSALTAWQSLFDTAHLSAKERVLIHAGAGGVGGFAIQFAKNQGATVLTTASAARRDYVKSFGADEVIDYTKENFVDKVHSLFPDGIEVVFDTMGGATLQASYDVLKQEGRLVSIGGTIDQALAAQKHLHATTVFVSANGKQLQKIADLFESGKLIPPRVQELPFDQVHLALRKSKEGHTEGKMVLSLK